MADEKSALLGDTHSTNKSASINNSDSTKIQGKTVTITENDRSHTPTSDTKASKLMFFAVLACVLGTSFQFGYALGALNLPETVIEDAYKYHFYDNSTSKPMQKSEVTLLWSLTVSLYAGGGLITGSLGGLISDKLGRRRGMLVMNTLELIAGALMFSSLYLKSFEVIIVGRFIQGLHGGFSTVVCPMYLNEISPLSLRGAIGTMNQLTVVVGLTISQIIGLPQLLGSEHFFYYILGIPAALSVVHWMMMFFCPESPAWLYINRDEKVNAAMALESLREGPINYEIDGYEQAVVDQASQRKVTLKDMFTTYRRRPMGIACVMMMSQQLSGVNAIIIFSTSIFQSAKLSASTAQYATLGLGGIQIIMTFISMVVIERLGRRTLHLHSLLGMLIFMTLCTSCLLVKDEVTWLNYGSIVGVAGFIISFAMGVGSIPWFYTAELFDSASTPLAMGIATAVNWLSNFAVGFLFKSMQQGMQNYMFLPFMVIISLCLIFLYYRMPETKGRSALSITAEFRTIQSLLNLPEEERRQYQTLT